MNQQRPPGCKQGEQSHSKLPPLTFLIVSYEKLLPMIHELSDFSGPDPSRQIYPREITIGNVLIIKSMGILRSSAEVFITW